MTAIDPFAALPSDIFVKILFDIAVGEKAAEELCRLAAVSKRLKHETQGKKTAYGTKLA